MLLSVIVPVFNAEKYLRECINSILAQSFHDFELILVNDGSKDSSGQICADYAKREPRVFVIHQENGGVTKARKTGVDNAKGEWIVFVDADDTIPKDSLETLMSSTGEMTDIAVARCDERKLPAEMTLDEYRRCCIAGRQIHSGPVARAFRSNLFNSQTFDIPREIYRGEDLIMNVRLAFATNKVPVLIDKKVYNYRQNENSVMHTNKHTADYSSLFFRHLRQSIPNPKDYEKEIISRKLSSIHSIIMDSPEDHSWRDSEFWHILQREIYETNYRLSIRERIMLKPIGKTSLKMALHTCHFIDIIQKFILVISKAH